MFTHTGVEASENVSKAFNEAGYNSMAVSGKTPREARETGNASVRSGDLKNHG